MWILTIVVAVVHKAIEYFLISLNLLHLQLFTLPSLSYILMLGDLGKLLINRGVFDAIWLDDVDWVASIYVILHGLKGFFVEVPKQINEATKFSWVGFGCRSMSFIFLHLTFILDDLGFNQSKWRNSKLLRQRFIFRDDQVLGIFQVLVE